MLFGQKKDGNCPSPEPTSRDNFRSGLALDPDFMYDYCVQYMYTVIELIFSTLSKEC
jgi:hypothetical protein